MTRRNVESPPAAAVPALEVARNFSFPPPRTVVAAPPGGYAGYRKLLGRLELGGKNCGGSWLESMKASSPTQTRNDQSISAFTGEDEYEEWLEEHPSALAEFDSVIAASRGKQIVMFLDYDGTLSPIVEDPDRAFMTEEMRDAVRDVAEQFPTAIVTGRCRDKVFNFVGLGELYYAGSHGMDIKGPTRASKHIKPKSKALLFQPASDFLPMIQEVFELLKEKMELIPGARVENNKFCASVHFRCVEEKKWSTLVEQVKAVLKEYPKLRLTQGRKVLEIRPMIKWDKGKALEFLLESLGYAECNDVFPVYIGDDRTDEDAFKVLKKREQGVGILVSKLAKETNASYSLREPAEVKQFLCKLVSWKCSLPQDPEGLQG